MTKPLLSFLVLQMLAQLIPKDGPPIPLKKDVTLIGRREFVCDVLIDDPGISQTHCLIVRLDNRYLVRDLGSFNGTCINDQQVMESPILDGDVLSLQAVTFRFMVDDVG
ncbi:MAG: FHA domain-containing protein [Fuerstiella sp.]